jgi:tape measure domain-containing protein
LGGFAGAFGPVGRAAAGVFAATFGTALAAGGFLAGFAIKGGIDRVLQTEEAVVQMGRLGLSVDEIDRLIGAVDDTFDGTVFTNPEGFALTQRLIGAGEELDSIPDRLSTISDFAAHGNVPLDQMGNIFERIIGQGRVTGEELNRLSDANIPLGTLAETLGLTIPELRKMTEEGEFTSDMFLQAATDAEMFRGAAHAAGDTTSGAFKNTLTQLKVLGEQLVKPLFGEDGPMVRLFKASRQALIDLRPQFKLWGEQLGNFLVPRIERLADWLSSGGLPDMFARLGDTARNLFDRIKQVGPSLGGLTDGFALLGGPLAIIARELFPLISPLLEAIIPPLAQLANGLAPALAKALGFLSEEILPGFIKIVEAVVGWITENKGLVIALGIAGIAFKIFSTIVAVNPFILLAAAVIAIVSLIITNWDSIVAFLKRVWTWIKTTVGQLWDTVKSAFKKALEFLVNLFLNWTLVGRIIKHWDAIKDSVRNLIDFVKNIWNGLVDWFKKLPGKIGRAVSGMWDGIKTAFRSALNWVIDKWNNFKITFPSIDTPFGSIGGFTIDTPNIPRLHDGGLVTGPAGSEMLAILEAGERVLSRAEVAAGADDVRGMSIRVETTGDARVLAREIERESRYALALGG